MKMLVPIMGKDPRWLQVEVCREFQRGKCSRKDDECRFAHPPAHVLIQNGRVTACFDSMKGRCQRENCKYLHPPKHIKSQLEANGRTVQQQQQIAMQQQALATHQMLANPAILPSWPLSTVPVSNGTMHLQQPLTFLPDPTLSTIGTGHRRLDKSDRLEVCREFQRGSCSRDELECRYAHPPQHVQIDSSDGMVTVCMDFMKSRCQRELCRYFHPPQHLQSRVRAAQQQSPLSHLALGEPFKKQATMELPQLVLPATFTQQLQQGMTTMQFAPTVIPTVPIMSTGLPVMQPQQQQATSDFNYMQPVESAQPQTYQIIDVPQEQNAEVPQWNQSPPPPPQTSPVEHPSNSFPNYVMYSEPSNPGSSYIYTGGYSPCVYYTIPPAFSS